MGVWTKAERQRMTREAAAEQDRKAIEKRKAELGKAQLARRDALRLAGASCRLDREKTQRQTASTFAADVDAARKKRDGARAAATARCAAGRDSAKEAHEPQISRLSAALNEEQTHQRTMKRNESARTARKKELAKRSGKGSARLAENEEELVGNLSPELVPLWNRVKGQIHGGPRRSRLEAFMEYVHEHPDELAQVQEELAERELRRLEREAHREHARAQPRAGVKKARKAGDDEGLAAAYFDELASAWGRSA